MIIATICNAASDRAEAIYASAGIEAFSSFETYKNAAYLSTAQITMNKRREQRIIAHDERGVLLRIPRPSRGGYSYAAASVLLTHEAAFQLPCETRSLADAIAFAERKYHVTISPFVPVVPVPLPASDAVIPAVEEVTYV